MRCRTSVLMSLIPCLVVAAACGGPTADSGGRSEPTKYAENGTFTMASPLDIGSFDPYRNRAIQNVFKLTYDSLVNLRPDGTFASGLAQTWSATNTTAMFRLRKNITCSDGTPLTAGQVADAIRFVGDPKNGAALYNTWVPAVPLTATGDDASGEVRVVLERPFGFLLRTIGRLPIVCAKGLKNPKLLGSGSVGTGPFVLSKVVPGQSYTFSVRKGYFWGPGGASTDAPGTPARVVIRIVENQTTAANLLLSGELNFARISGEDRQRLIAQNLKAARTPNSGAWLWFNHIGNRPTSDPGVRRALVQALDLNEVTKVNTGSSGARATGLIETAPKPCPGDTVSGELPTQDTAAAEALLDQAGWTKGADGYRRNQDGKLLRLNLHYLPPISPREKPTAELIAQRWNAVGVQTKLTTDTYNDYYQVFYKTSNYDVYMAGFGFDLPSQMMERLSGPTPPKGTNGAGIDNREYNALSAKAVSIAAPASCGLWSKAEKALYRNVDIVPIARTTETSYLQRAEAKVIAFEWPIPTSIRVLK